MEEEIWKEVVGWEGLYQVSNFGRVKSLPRLHNAKHPYITKEKILSPRVCGNQREYLAVMLCGKYTTKQKRIHRLVAEAFIPNPNGYKEINHKDENKGNNHASNLEWCSRKYNINYGNRALKMALSTSIHVEQLDEYSNVIHTFSSMKEASQFIGVDSSNISKACSCKRKCKGYYWRYKKGYHGRSNN